MKRLSVVVGIAAAGIGVLVAQPLAGMAATVPQHVVSAAVPALSVPTVTVPTVSTPTVTTPRLTTPTVTTPTVTTPTVTTPKVTTPTVTTPKVTTPTVTTPKVTTPTVTTPKVTTPTVTTPKVTTPVPPGQTTPKVTTPRVSTPVGTVPSATTPSAGTRSVTGVVRTTASTVSAASGAATHRAGTSSAPGSPGSAASAAGAATSGAGAVAGGQTGPANGSTPSVSGDAASASAVDAVFGRTGASPPQSPRERRLAAARESRRLRRLVARLRGCLGTLDGRARHLLSLRAGLHGPARSSAATARILHLSARREARLERLAVAALGRSAATGCAGSPAAVTRMLAMASGGLPALSSISPGTAGTGSGSAPGASLHSARGGRSSSAGSGNLAVTPARARTEQAETGASFPSAFVTALLLILLAVAMVVVPKLRHRPAPVAGTVGAAGVAQSRAEPAPGARSGTPTAAPPRTKTGGRPFRTRVAPMDSAIAPMAADAFSRMSNDVDEAADPESTPPADDASEHQAGEPE